jgi:hypothetical protein
VTQLDNQFGISDESTYGTRVAPAYFVDFVSEGIERQQNNRVSAGLRKGQKVQRSDHQSQAMKGANGPLQLDLAAEGVSKFLKHLFGKAPVVTQPAVGTDPTVYDHTFTLGDGAGLSFSSQVGRPGSAGTVRAFDYTGCKVADGTISNGIDDYASLALTVDAQNEDDTQTLVAAPTYPASQNLFHDGHLSVTVNATAFFSKSSSVKIDRQLALDRFFQRASSIKKEPLANALAVATGDLMGEFEDLTTFDLFRNGTIVQIVLDWVGATISTTYKRELKLTLPACRLDGPKPKTNGPGILDADTPFTILYDGTNEPITALLRTTDVTS